MSDTYKKKPGTEKELWFPHRLTAHNDPKIQALLGEYGGIGYGLYWLIVELLHLDRDNKLPLKQYTFLAIAKQVSANAKQLPGKIKQEVVFADEVHRFIKDCIEVFDLFVCNETHFWSNKVLQNIENRNTLSKKMSDNGKKGADAKQNSASAKQLPSKS